MAIERAMLDSVACEETAVAALRFRCAGIQCQLARGRPGRGAVAMARAMVGTPLAAAELPRCTAAGGGPSGKAGRGWD